MDKMESAKNKAVVHIPLADMGKMHDVTEICSVITTIMKNNSKGKHTSSLLDLCEHAMSLEDFHKDLKGLQLFKNLHIWEEIQYEVLLYNNARAAAFYCILLVYDNIKNKGDNVIPT